RLGHGGQHCRPDLRRRDAGQLRLAAGGEQPQAQRDRRAAQLPHRFPEQDPHLVDRVRVHRAGRRHLLPCGGAPQGVRPGDRAGRRRRATGFGRASQSGGPARGMSDAGLSMSSPPWPGPAPEAAQILGPAPPPITRGPGTTVHAQIEDWLAELISVGRLAPGDRMPTEQDLAAWLGVSRMTLRHALANLARRGLVTRTVGRRGGTFVAESKLEQDLTTLAGFSEQLRRHGMVAGARVLSATERPAGPVAAAALEVTEGAPLYEVRRVRLGDGRPIALEHSLFPAALFPGMLGCRLDGSLYELLESNYGQRPC